MNTKFSIGVVVAIVLQVSAFVWWTAQQAQTIDQLNEQVSNLTSRMAIEDDIKCMQLMILMSASLDSKNLNESWINSSS